MLQIDGESTPKSPICAPASYTALCLSPLVRVVSQFEFRLCTAEEANEVSKIFSEESAQMAAPDVLSTPSYVHVWTGNLNVAGKPKTSGGVTTPGKISNKRFITYVEVSEQGAHDPKMRSLAQARRLAIRPMHRGRVNPNNPAQNAAAAPDYYEPHGQMAASLVGAEMTRRWTVNNTNNTVFGRGVATRLAIQSIRQDNGHCYEITMWYDVNDVYVAFHCYDPDYGGR